MKETIRVEEETVEGCAAGGGGPDGIIKVKSGSPSLIAGNAGPAGIDQEREIKVAKTTTACRSGAGEDIADLTMSQLRRMMAWRALWRSFLHEAYEM